MVEAFFALGLGFRFRDVLHSVGSLTALWPLTRANAAVFQGEPHTVAVVFLIVLPRPPCAELRKVHVVIREVIVAIIRHYQSELHDTLKVTRELLDSIFPVEAILLVELIHYHLLTLDVDDGYHTSPRVNELECCFSVGQSDFDMLFHNVVPLM